MKYRITWQTIATHHMILDDQDLRRDEQPHEWFQRHMENDKMYDIDADHDPDDKQITFLNWSSA